MILYNNVHDTFRVMIEPDELDLMTNLNSNLDFVLADSNHHLAVIISRLSSFSQ